MLQRGPKDHTIYFNLIDEGREDSLAGKNTTLPGKVALDYNLGVSLGNTKAGIYFHSFFAI